MGGIFQNLGPGLPEYGLVQSAELRGHCDFTVHKSTTIAQHCPGCTQDHTEKRGTSQFVHFCSVMYLKMPWGTVVKNTGGSIGKLSSRMETWERFMASLLKAPVGLSGRMTSSFYPHDCGLGCLCEGLPKASHPRHLLPI